VRSRDRRAQPAEDWEHEAGVMTDDDEAPGVDDQAEAVEEAQPRAPPRALQVEGEVGAGAASAEETGAELDEAGRSVQRLLQQHKRKGAAEGAGEDEELFEDDDEQDAFEDEDFVDPDKDARLAQILAGGPPPPPPKSAPPKREAVEAAAAAPAEPAEPAGALKRPRSPEAAAEEPPPKAPRVMTAEMDAQLQDIQDKCGVGLEQLRAALAGGGMSLRVRLARVSGWLACRCSHAFTGRGEALQAEHAHGDRQGGVHGAAAARDAPAAGQDGRARRVIAHRELTPPSETSAVERITFSRCRRASPFTLPAHPYLHTLCL
jgi:hypothetical protein